MDEEQVRQIIRDELSNIFKIDRIVLDKNIQILDKRNIQLGIGTGTKFGTAATQKLGLWGTLPVVQQSAITDATVQNLTGGDTVSKSKVTADVLSVETAVNLILAALRNIGIIAT